jgi:uncharacterized protein (DUF1778 family)
MIKRTKTLLIRVQPAEGELFRRAAAADGETVSSWARRLLRREALASVSRAELNRIPAPEADR